ncbi:MAG TPA: molecular chaperone DnaK [Chloroflexi bacterium]|nr:molecular chaperone DnaK [Chloroflexota bacterium]
MSYPRVVGPLKNTSCQFGMSGVEYVSVRSIRWKEEVMPFSYDRMRSDLLDEQAKLREQLNRLEANAHQENIGYGNHMADDATEAFDQTVDVALQRKVEQSLERVNRALAKLDNGTYGLCEECGARIDRARLEALPQARYCLDCQSQKEYRA